MQMNRIIGIRDGVGICMYNVYNCRQMEAGNNSLWENKILAKGSTKRIITMEY